MAAKFKISETCKGSSFQETKEKAYTATLVTNREIKAKEFSEILSKKTRVNEIDCLKILMTISEEIANNLMEGNIVRIDQIGSFRITAKSAIVKREEEVTPETIGSPSIVFTPSSELKKKLSGIRYEKE